MLTSGDSRSPTVGHDPTGSRLTTFSGRFLELVHLHSLLVSDAQPVLSGTTGIRRPVCVVGMGGIGKTLLVEEYARRFGPNHPVASSGSSGPGQPENGRRVRLHCYEFDKEETLGDGTNIPRKK